MIEEKSALCSVEATMSHEPKKFRERPSKFERLVQPCIAEIVGTAFFVFIGCVSVIENTETTGRFQPALVHGIAVVALVACMAEISGSHFNPPFTIAIYLCGGMELSLVVPYVISQLIGGLLGAAMSKLMTTREKYAQATGAAFTTIQSEDQLAAAIFGEAAMTCLVTLVVLMGAVNHKTKSPLVPVLVGGAIVICILAGGDVSGTCLNPARALGPALIMNYWTHHWVYWAGPTGGSLAAVALVRLLLGDEKTRLILK
ncbi:aquaporin-8-like [Conger conger]|uniref:aquaporin-8-like n=1 Tax=Conger conger TaxID=82655 RepID=UPI002A5983DA|nr:aquaporin-8-like [Conger conger]